MVLLHVLFLCNKIFQKEKDEGKAILLPASCDAGKKLLAPNQPTLWSNLYTYVNFFPLGCTTVYGRRLYKVTLAPSIGTTKHVAS
jgi:hypothetical protein